MDKPAFGLHKQHGPQWRKNRISFFRVPDLAGMGNPFAVGKVVTGNRAVPQGVGRHHLGKIVTVMLLYQHHGVYREFTSGGG